MNVYRHLPDMEQHATIVWQGIMLLLHHDWNFKNGILYLVIIGIDKSKIADKMELKLV